MGVREGRLELSKCLQSYTPALSLLPFLHTHMQAVTRCDVAVNELVLDMKVSM